MNMSQINALDQEELFMEMQLAREENRAHFILQHILADGTVRDVEVYSGPIMVQGRQLLYSVIHDVTARIRLENEMKALATTDGLTGIDNRHQFFSQGSRELRRALRYKKPLSLLMLDIDYFKSINDTYGHQAGDEVLRRLARAVSSLLRETDLFGRLGGEEFAVVPAGNRSQAGHGGRRTAAQMSGGDLGRVRGEEDIIHGFHRRHPGPQERFCHRGRHQTRR